MRKPERLSYSAWALFERDPEAFYLERLAAARTKREPQGLPAALGSGFDARVKSGLALCLFGPARPESLELTTLFEAQVEPQHRDRVSADSDYAFTEYVTSGAYADLLAELEKSPVTPQFEFELQVTLGDVPTAAKPDLTYATPDGTSVIHDWKVKSFYSKSGASPTKGYRRLRSSGVEDKRHELYAPMGCGGAEIHAGPLCQLNPAYADQTSLYAWSAGLAVGEKFIASIDELVCRPRTAKNPGPGPALRVAELRAVVDGEYQHDILRRFQRCWRAIQSEHVFVNLSLEESRARQALLEKSAVTMCGGGDDDRYFAGLNKKGWF